MNSRLWLSGEQPALLLQPVSRNASVRQGARIQKSTGAARKNRAILYAELGARGLRALFFQQQLTQGFDEADVFALGPDGDADVAAVEALEG